MGQPLIGPIVELGHDIGLTIVGGYVYRGKAMSDFQGRYIFGDWSHNSTLLVATPPAGWNWSMPTSADNLTASDVQMWTIEEIRVATNPNGWLGAYLRGFGVTQTTRSMSWPARWQVHQGLQVKSTR